MSMLLHLPLIKAYHPVTISTIPYILKTLSMSKHYPVLMIDLCLKYFYILYLHNKYGTLTLTMDEQIYS